jgi:hypothetical protein
MIRFAWLQFRTQAAVAVGGLAVVAVVLAITGPHLVHGYDTSAASCRAHGDCPAVMAVVLRTYHDLEGWLGVLVVAVPAIIGIFWGAPLAARELETGTYRLAWTQSVTRTRWMAIKLGVIGLASMVTAGLLSLMVTWWASPLDRVSMSPFGSFDQRDIVPVGYAAFAFALGVTAGLLIRRTLPAMATTLAVFAGARLVIARARPHLIGALQITVRDNQIAASGPVSPLTGAVSPRDWVLSDQTINAAGHVIGQDGITGDGLDISVGPHGVIIQGLGSCPNIRPPRIHSGSPSQAAGNALVQRCVDQLRVRQLLTYQPASRYWAFQWYEMAIVFGLALLLAGFCIWQVRRRRSERIRIQRSNTTQAPALEDLSH